MLFKKPEVRAYNFICSLQMRAVTLFVLLFCAAAVYAQDKKHAPSIPHLTKQGSSTQLIVDGLPFLILGGELGNSTASSSAYMKPVWASLKKMNLNTVIAPVYWELMEPKEGVFDFKLVDELIVNARANNLKVVILWFGAWKNSMSCYAPGWVKTNTGRFPRTLNKNGKPGEILSPFSSNNLKADQRAFAQLMTHVKKLDSKAGTVIMVQVENEIGMLPNARCYEPRANAAFEAPVPSKFIRYLQANKEALLPEAKKIWGDRGFKTQGNWEDIFGQSLATDELFMAWYYAVFTEELAAAGKAAYNLPMYVNAALNRPGKKPGEYPSAGPLPQVTDAWRAAGNSIDILAPDFYNPDFKHWCDLFTRRANPLFIPEIKFEPGIDAKAFFAFGNYNCLSFSPFSIESTNNPGKEPITRAYEILSQLTPLITKYQTAGSVKGFLLSKDSSETTVTMGGYIIHVKHEYTLGWSPGSKKEEWPLTGGLIIMTAPGELYVNGTGIVVTFEPIAANKVAGFISVDEGVFKNGRWVAGRRMNGDQDHQGRHVRVAVNDYGIQHARLYSY
jgi:beta-galactosidase GanA